MQKLKWNINKLYCFKDCKLFSELGSEYEYIDYKSKASYCEQ